MSKKERNIKQYGDKSVYAENVNDLHVHKNKEYSNKEIIEKFSEASSDLKNYKNSFGTSNIPIPRRETEKLFDWIKLEQDKIKTNIAILVGKAGTGKSVILNNLLKRLNKADIPVLGIKSDTIAFSDSEKLSKELSLEDNIDILFKKLNASKSVLIIDQIDALSQSLSTDRASLYTLRRIIDRLAGNSNVRIVISCREFDLHYDPVLESYSQKEIFPVSPLSPEDVKRVLLSNEFDNEFSNNFLNFLRTPLHLEIFCKTADPENSNEFLSLQELYESFWEKFIINNPRFKSLDKDKIIKLIEDISFAMYDNQSIFVNEIDYKDDYPQEIDYLLSHGILSKSKSKIQFIHQSFFDFVYARAFVKSKQRLSQKILEDHQGLFVRPKIRQVLSYLRTKDQAQYLTELRTLLTHADKDYRLHIRHLILTDLGQIEEPYPEEKELIKEIVDTNELLFKIFIESVGTVEWFKYLRDDLNLKGYLKKDDKDYYNSISLLCRKVLNKETSEVVLFLNKLPVFTKRNEFISWVLLTVKDKNAEAVIPLFEQTKDKWDEYSYYRFLDKLTDTKPEFVMTELMRKYKIHKREAAGTRNYIPGGYETGKIYEDLYENPNKSVPFFIEIIKCIVSSSQEREEINSQTPLKSDSVYFLFAPEKSSNRKIHEKIYDYIIKYIKTNASTESDTIKQEILPLLKSDYASILNFALVLMIEAPEKYLDEAFELFTRKDFLINYRRYHQFFSYNVEELLKISYPLFSQEQKNTVNELIKNTIPQHEKSKKGAYDAKGVSRWGYTRFGLTRHTLLSLIPTPQREKDRELKKIYLEGLRRYGEINRKRPVGTMAYPLGAPHSTETYEKLSLEEWYNLMKKYTKEERRFDDPYSLTELFRAFESEVSKRPEFFAEFIKKLIADDEIIDMYIVYGLQGLKKGNYNAEKTKQIFIQLIQERYKKIRREGVQYLVWLTDYFIDNNAVNSEIIGFLSQLAKEYPENELANPEDPIHAGINSVRGAAVDRIVRCYQFKEFEEEIFSTLEFLAKESKEKDTVSVATRASALFRLALLNNLNKQRNIKLFLDLNHDFYPKLLSLPLHNLHPLVYLIHVDFSKLYDFFKKAIEVPESHEVMSHILFFAYLNGYDGSKDLLDKVLDASIEAKIKVVEVGFKQLKDERFFEKSIEVIEQFITIDNEKLGEAYEQAFMQLSENDFGKLESFIDKYIKSKVGKYREYNFYRFLLKAVKFNPEKCLDWALMKPKKGKRMLEREPVEVVLQAYNGLKKYKDPNDKQLKKAMDMFDELLKQPEYRSRAFEVINKMEM